MIKPIHTDLFAVIGNPVRHSLSPAMMNAAFKALEIPAVYVALQADDLMEDLKALCASGFRGLSVTLPHKELAFRFTQEVDEIAQIIGAVNTLMRRGAAWVGINTDWMGATKALSRVTRLDGKHALVLGAGGASRAVTFGLKREGAQVTVANRCVEKGMALAKLFRCEFVPLTLLEKTRRGLEFRYRRSMHIGGTDGNGADDPRHRLVFPPGHGGYGHGLQPCRDPFPAFGQSGRGKGHTRARNAPSPGSRPTGMVVCHEHSRIPRNRRHERRAAPGCFQGKTCSSELNRCPGSTHASESRVPNPSLIAP